MKLFIHLLLPARQKSYLHALTPLTLAPIDQEFSSNNLNPSHLFVYICLSEFRGMN